MQNKKYFTKNVKMSRKYLVILIFFFCSSFAFGQNNEMEANDIEIIGHFIFIPDISITFTNETEANRRLDRMAADLKNRNLSPGQILVSGFAAMEPTTLSPVTLSINRSSFIINELVKRGVPWELFTTPVGYGYVSFWGPLYENRRAVVSIIAPGAGGCCNCADLVERFERLSAEWDESPIRTGAITGWFAGAGPEANAYTRTNFSAGGYLSWGVELFHHYALGLRIGYYSNLKDGDVPTDLLNLRTDTFEAAFLFRYYMPFKNIFSGIFIEGNVGMTSFRELGNAYIAPHGGIAAGWRFEFLERFYIDPTARIGSPFMWGFGAAIGVIF